MFWATEADGERIKAQLAEKAAAERRRLAQVERDRIADEKAAAAQEKAARLRGERPPK